MKMLDKLQVWENVFLSSTRRIPTTCAISVLIDENEIYFYFIQVNSVCQGLNKYEKFPNTLCHTSYASGNFMLVYECHTIRDQVQWSRVAVEHCGEIKELYYICIQICY